MKNNEKGIPEENQMAIEALSSRVHQLESMPIKNALPVGSILLSALSKTAFQAQYDGTWVPCHGQEIEGFGKVPDLQDRFPRVVADEEKLGKTQEQSTNKGDLSVGISEFTAGTVSIKESLKGNSEPSNADIKMFRDTRPPARGLGGDWHFYAGVNEAIKARVKKPNSDEYYKNEHNLIGADPNEGIKLGHGGQQIFKDVGHKHEVKLTLDKTFPVEGASCSAELSGGDNETRPKACYINAFIRVA